MVAHCSMKRHEVLTLALLFFRLVTQPRFETVMSELILVKNEALHAMANLKKWMQPRQVDRTLVSSVSLCCSFIVLSVAWITP